MIINTKYAIGDEVYAFYEQDGEIHIFKDKITEIVITENKQLYYLQKHDCDEWTEEELVKINDTEKLIEIIEKLTGGN